MNAVDAISVESLKKNGFSQVRKVITEEGQDSTGDAAIFVWVLLDNKVPDKSLTWERIRPLVDFIKEQVSSTDNAVWPYVRVRRLREWADLANPEELE